MGRACMGRGARGALLALGALLAAAMPGGALAQPSAPAPLGAAAEECAPLPKKPCKKSERCRWGGRGVRCAAAKDACDAVQGKKLRKKCARVSAIRCQCSKKPEKKQGKCGTCAATSPPAEPPTSPAPPLPTSCTEVGDGPIDQTLILLRHGEKPDHPSNSPSDCKPLADCELPDVKPPKSYPWCTCSNVKNCTANGHKFLNMTADNMYLRRNSSDHECCSEQSFERMAKDTEHLPTESLSHRGVDRAECIGQTFTNGTGSSNFGGCTKSKPCRLYAYAHDMDNDSRHSERPYQTLIPLAEDLGYNTGPNISSTKYGPYKDDDEYWEDSGKVKCSAAKKIKYDILTQEPPLPRDAVVVVAYEHSRLMDLTKVFGVKDGHAKRCCPNPSEVIGSCPCKYPDASFNLVWKITKLNQTQALFTNGTQAEACDNSP